MRLLLRRSFIAAAIGSLLLTAFAVQAQPRGGVKPTVSGAPVAATAGVAPQSEDELNEQDKRMLGLAREAASKISMVMERWVRTGRISQKKLFAYLYYPIPKTEPQKFHTDYDTLSDQEVQPVEEQILTKDPSVAFCILIDRNGYVPTHNLKFAKPLTGHIQIDLVNNRTKRIFNDRTGFRAGRNQNPFLLQVYSRDTGEMMKDMSVPIVLFGKHWGGIRMGYAPK